MLNLFPNGSEKNKKGSANNMVTNNRHHNRWAYFLDGFSLSGAIILIFTILTFYGVATKQEKVWQNFATALTTFVSAKKVSDYETEKDKRKVVRAAVAAGTTPVAEPTEEPK